MTLTEAEYKDFFSKGTLSALRGKSAQSLQSMIRGNLQQALMRTQRSLPALIQLEKPHRPELEALAEVIVREVYGIADENQVKIYAKLGPNLPSPYREEEEEEQEQDHIDDLFPEEAKRRIINSITQGGAVRGTFSFNLFKEYLDQINPEIVEKYNALMKDAFGVYDDDNAIAMFMQMMATKSAQAGGESEGYFDEEAGQFVVRASGLVFPMLLHEVIKGLYEVVAQEGFSRDLEANKKIIGRVDKLSNEPEDIRYGKFIFDAVNDLVNTYSTGNDNRLREYFLAEVYKLEDVEFVQFVENLINQKLTSTQNSWASRTIKDIESDLKKQDTGLTGLDYDPDQNDSGEEDDDDDYLV